MGLVVPVVVRQLTPGSFWMGILPYDSTLACYFCIFSHGVEWHWINYIPGIPWYTACAVMPGLPLSPCDAAGDTGYDGISPDHFVIYAVSSGGAAPAAPDGYDVVTLTFDVNSVPGQFELDTSCWTSPLHTIYMIDDDFPPVDHGPSGTGECTFDKGVITILPCMCGIKGDLNNDGPANPLDVVYLLNYVYWQADDFVYPEGWECPYAMGDFDCNDDISPLDALYLIALVFQGRDYVCNPCDSSP